MRAIVLFARSPRREAAAKRLPARLFDAVTAMWIDAARRCGAVPVIACETADRASFDGLEWIAQGEGTFGQRVARVTGEAFARGFGQVIVAAIDAPPRDVARAFESLERGVAVVSPARDGGINYIGLVTPERALLETFVPRDRALLQRCRTYFDELLVVRGAVDLDDAKSLDAARSDRAWSLLLEAPLAPVVRIAHVRSGVTHAHTSRPPPL